MNIEKIYNIRIYTGGKGVKDLSKSWWVEATFFNPATAKRERIKYKGGINRFHTVKERYQEAAFLKQALIEKIRSGYEPFKRVFTFGDALNIAYDAKMAEISPKSQQTLRGVYARLCECFGQIAALELDCVTRKEIVALVDKMALKYALSNHGYNKALDWTKSLLSVLVEKGYIHLNPALGINHKKHVSDGANLPPTQAEKILIRDHLEKTCPDFWTFCLLIYHTGLRPVECTRLRVEMVDLDNGLITLPASEGKTNIRRLIPLPEEMINRLKTHLTHDGVAMSHDGDKDFVFSLSYKRGWGSLGRNRFTKTWEKHVKKALKIKANLYSLKHLGTDDKIRAGLSMASIQYQYGHTNPRTTEIYGRAIKNEYLNELRKAPKFL